MIMNDTRDADIDIPVPWFLLTHPQGNVVIDGGNAAECISDPVAYWGEVARDFWPDMQPEDDCVRALDSVGVDAESVRYVLHSHLHTDHTGAIGRFPNATHIVQRAEYSYGLEPDWFAEDEYLLRELTMEGVSWQFLNAGEDDFLDLFGDESLVIIHTPGHSPGHQSFLVKLRNNGHILLALDAAYTMVQWEQKALPGILTSAVEVAQSLRKLRRIADRHEAMVVPGHDADQWATFRLAPGYYD
ncbi:MAG: N-acyl homoserine lactonase family protein [Halofilum sp. (in: g-proteobacteria)]|nr:N-acyl homoserine lactonase family protein [Halofilum sp. (in: g-proteobacteria)]